MNKTDIIKQTIEDLLDKMTFSGQVFVDRLDGNIVIANIETDEPNFLIGQAGANLDVLQHIARILVGKKANNKEVHFLLDINNYRKNRIDLLREMAKSIARQALNERVAVTLQPMPAYERRIIHLVLTDNPQVVTESIGAGDKRKVVVKPALDYIR